MAPAGAGLIDDSHGGVGPPPPAAKAAPPPASTPTPAKATAAAAVSASERILPLMKTPSTCESDEPAPSAPPRLSPPMRARTVPWAVSVPAAPPSAGTWEPPVRLDRWHRAGPGVAPWANTARRLPGGDSGQRRGQAGLGRGVAPGLSDERLACRGLEERGCAAWVAEQRLRPVQRATRLPRRRRDLVGPAVDDVQVAGVVV